MNKSAFFRFIGIVLPASVLFLASAAAAAEKPDPEKIKKIRYAISNEILSLYDIPFHVYVNQEMWPEIYAVLNQNLKSRLKRRLPEPYFSRPCIFKDRILLFANGGGSGRLLEFDPATLVRTKEIQHAVFSDFNGGVRELFGKDIIFGASFQDTDKIAILDGDTGTLRALALQEGHYVTALHVFNERLYAGACGGIVNAWKYEDGAPIGVYRTDVDENQEWSDFNASECISDIFFYGGRLMAVGERALYAWELDNPQSYRALKKEFPDGLHLRHENFFVEYKNRTIVIHDLNHQNDIQTITAPGIIEDIAVTSASAALPDAKGPMLIASMRHNQGLNFYDLETLRELALEHLPGENLAVLDNVLYATDDDHLYKFQLKKTYDPGYQRFIQTIDLDKINFKAHPVKKLIHRLDHYPEFIVLSGLHTRWLEQNKIDFGAEIHRLGSTEPRKDSESAAEASAFRAVCRVQNNSKDIQLITFRIHWAGGDKEPAESVNALSSGGMDSGASIHRVPEHTVDKSIILQSKPGAQAIKLNLGHETPLIFHAYPVGIDALSKSLYAKFQTALSKDNHRTSLVDKFLEDNRFKFWHARLSARKKAIIKENKDKPWIVRFFLNLF